MAHSYFNQQPSTQAIKETIKNFGAWLEIDLDAISFNLQQVRARIGAEVEIMPVMKNDAYGHGLVPMVAHLHDSGCQKVLVAKLWEAFALRRAVPECNVVCMDALHTDSHVEHVVEEDIIPVIFDLDVARRLSAAAQRQFKQARVFVKIDTGLRRIGIAHDQAPELLNAIRELGNIEILTVMSTFMQHPDHDTIILERFLRTCDQAGITGNDGVQRSMGSTDSILHFPQSALELVRPAMCLLGVYPFEGDEDSGIELHQALTMQARVEMVKSIKAGESVSYFGSFVAPKPMRIGTVHAGFFDGIPREVANKATYFAGDIPCSTLGSISLNHTLVDLTETAAQAGDVMTIIGRESENSVKTFASHAGWMAYSVFNHLNLLLPRVYFKSGKPVAVLDRASELYGI